MMNGTEAPATDTAAVEHGLRVELTPLAPAVAAPAAPAPAARVKRPRDSHVRSLVKGVSWRIMGTLATAMLVFVFTGKFQLALFVGAVEFVSKIGLYWAHERIWERIGLGLKKTSEPAVLWFTGLSGAGKTTIARRVCEELQAQGVPVEFLDGDAIRDVFPQTGFSRAERDEHVKRVGFLASRLERNGVFVVASFISPYAESRAFVRGLCRKFVEIHVATPLDECERRDVKGLYARVRSGELTAFTGIDDPYEAPTAPELTIDTRGLTVEQAARQVVDHIRPNL